MCSELLPGIISALASLQQLYSENILNLMDFP